MKNAEYDKAFTSLNFPPAIHFFHAKDLMLQSQVFQFIRQMPKGYRVSLNENETLIGGI